MDGNEIEQTRWNNAAEDEDPADPTIRIELVDDVDENGNPPRDQTLRNPDTDQMIIQLMTTRLKEVEPHHWIVIFQPYYNCDNESILTWFHVFHERPRGYTTSIERSSWPKSIVGPNWRSSEYVCWIPTLMHNEMIRMIDKNCLKKRDPSQRFVSAFLHMLVDEGLLMEDKAAELDLVVLPAPDEPGQEDAFPDARIPRADPRMMREG
ncbi:hypothetical protein BJY01DRAFT_255108 [Aspergillus pseudoustus]|uniref:Uncharacterized protein n=1 Tax=Aspergillus pseudoustus TaxID=1810923 RepID=A0ABR4IN62_9EURO